MTPEHRVCALPAVRLSCATFALTDQPFWSWKVLEVKEVPRRAAQLAPSRPRTSGRRLCVRPGLAAGCLVPRRRLCGPQRAGRAVGADGPPGRAPWVLVSPQRPQGPVSAPTGCWVPTAQRRPRRVEGSAAGDRGSRGPVTGLPSLVTLRAVIEKLPPVNPNRVGGKSRGAESGGLWHHTTATRQLTGRHRRRCGGDTGRRGGGQRGVAVLLGF